MSALEAKIVVLGSQNVGKTSLVHRLVHHSFLSPSVPSTVGASFVTAKFEDPLSDTTIRLQIWDTAGQERFRSISRLYYRGAHAAVLCYDITSKKSFDDMGVWLRELRDSVGTNSSGNDVIVHIVGTKADIVAEDPDKREVPFERCIEYVQNELYPTVTPAPIQDASRLRPQPQQGLSRSWSSAKPRPQPKTSMAEKQNLHKRASSGNQLASDAGNKRTSGFWGSQETVWDCCHEISAKDGSGIDRVFQIITRKLVEQHTQRIETQRALDTSMGRAINGDWRPATPVQTPGARTPGGMRGSSANLQQAGYFDLPAGTTGSFRLGYGDKRRSWLGLTATSSLATTPGALSNGAYSSDTEGNVDIGLAKYQTSSGRCC